MDGWIPQILVGIQPSANQIQLFSGKIQLFSGKIQPTTGKSTTALSQKPVTCRSEGVLRAFNKHGFDRRVKFLGCFTLLT